MRSSFVHPFRFLASLGLAGLLLAGLWLPLHLPPSWGQGLPQRDVLFLIDNSPSVRTGEGAPDEQPTDPNDLRIRISRFVVNVLSALGDAPDQRVGVISFAGRSQELMPLTPVTDWSKADFGAVRALDQGRGTDFSNALDLAVEMLFPPGAPDCTAGERECYIVILSDGVFDFARDASETRTVLEQLHDRGVQVTMLTFAEEFKGEWEELAAADLLDRYQPNVASLPMDEVYRSVLSDLGAAALLAGMQVLDVAGQETVPLEVLPYRHWVRYQVFPDGPMAVTFLRDGQPIAPLVAGPEYTLFLPQEGEWELRLEGDGMVYYRLSDEEVAEVRLHLEKPEGVLEAGQPLPISARLALGAGESLTALERFTATAIITGPERVIGPLTLQPDPAAGRFIGTVAGNQLEATGRYTVSVRAESAVRGVEIAPLERAFRLALPPTLALTIAPPGALEPGQTVYITVTVGNHAPGYTPRLELYGPGAAGWQPPALVEQGDGLFTAEIAGDGKRTAPFAIAAYLDAGRTPEGLEFGERWTEPAPVYFTHPGSPRIKWWSVNTMPLCVLGIIVGIIVGSIVRVFISFPIYGYQRKMELERRIGQNDSSKSLAGLIKSAVDSIESKSARNLQAFRQSAAEALCKDHLAHWEEEV